MLVTLQEAKEYLKLDPSSTLEDGMLQLFIQTAQEEMEMLHGRKFEFNKVSGGAVIPHEETLSGPGDTQLFLKHYPVYRVLEVARISPDGTAEVIPPANYQLDPQRGVLYGQWYSGVQNYRVKYEGGYVTPDRQPPSGLEYEPEPLPQYLKLECLEKVAYLYENRQGVR